ncbi:hypothetical protein GCM10010399_74260 [Dactylosporangium fulvum]
MTECARVILCDPNAHASRAGDREAVDIPGADITDDQSGDTHRAIIGGVAGRASLGSADRGSAGRGPDSSGRAGVENHGPVITVLTGGRLNGRTGAAAGRNGAKRFEVAA